MIALAFWMGAFPFLSRFATNEIAVETVEAKLREIKANIVAMRLTMNRGRVDPMEFDAVRARIAGQLGSRTQAVIAAEDKSRSRWNLAKAVGMTAAMIALAFLPGGFFIDTAIGIAIAANTWDRAAMLGRAANTGQHVDDGLVSQSAAKQAQFAAVLSTVLALMGTAATGLKVLRFGRALVGVRQSLPELALAEQGAIARAIADDPKLVSTFSNLASGDVAISTRVVTAVRQAGGSTAALRTSLQDVATIAAIPRKAATGADLYSLLRAITDGRTLSESRRRPDFRVRRSRSPNVT